MANKTIDSAPMEEKERMRREREGYHATVHFGFSDCIKLQFYKSEKRSRYDGPVIDKVA